MQNRDSFINAVLEKFSEERKRRIMECDASVVDLEARCNQEIEILEQQNRDNIDKECSRISSHYEHLMKSCRDRAFFSEKRKLLSAAEKGVRDELRSLRGSEEYYQFLKRTLDRHLSGRNDPLIIYSLAEDAEKLAEMTHDHSGDIRFLPLQDRRPSGYELGGFCLKFSSENIIFDCTVETRLSRFLENHAEILFSNA